MTIHSVSYDLRAPGRDYTALYALLKDQSAWCRVTESHWLVENYETADVLMEKIRRIIDANDVATVFTVATPTAWWTFGLSKEQNDWIRQRLSS